MPCAGSSVFACHCWVSGSCDSGHLRRDTGQEELQGFAEGLAEEAWKEEPCRMGVHLSMVRGGGCREMRHVTTLAWWQRLESPRWKDWVRKVPCNQDTEPRVPSAGDGSAAAAQGPLPGPFEECDECGPLSAISDVLSANLTSVENFRLSPHPG